MPSDSQTNWSEQITPEHTINFDNDSERKKFLRHHLRNEIKCEVCESNNFKAEQNSPQQIMLTCTNCGWVHIISPETFGDQKLYLKFCHQKNKQTSEV
ncbi:MAG: hypothetical protein NWF06_11010 [Candidatus Bathyarchaeota archaeon]|nr:hypothetical protein [Candidatus Bathyarchaeum sp.]